MEYSKRGGKNLYLLPPLFIPISLCLHLYNLHGRIELAVNTIHKGILPDHIDGMRMIV